MNFAVCFEPVYAVEQDHCETLCLFKFQETFVDQILSFPMPLNNISFENFLCH